MKKKVFSIILAVMMVLAVPFCVSASDFNLQGLSSTENNSGSGYYMVSNNVNNYLINSSKIWKYDITLHTGWIQMPYNSAFSTVKVYGGYGCSGLYYVKNNEVYYSEFNTSTNTWSNTDEFTLPTDLQNSSNLRLEYCGTSGLFLVNKAICYNYDNNTLNKYTNLPFSDSAPTLLSTGHGFYVAGSGGLYKFVPVYNTWNQISSDNLSNTQSGLSRFTITTDGATYAYKIGGIDDTTRTYSNSLIRYDLNTGAKTNLTLNTARRLALAKPTPFGEVYIIGGTSSTDYVLTGEYIPQ
jgi:hypothetical protein